MPTPQRPIEDAILDLTSKHRWLYGEPFFGWANCEIERMQADDLADELAQQGYTVAVIDDYTVSWEPPPDEIHIRSRPTA